MSTAPEIDVSYPVTLLHETLDGVVGKVVAVTEVDVVKVFLQLSNGEDGGVGYVSTFGQHDIAQAGGDVDNPLNSSIG